MIIDLFHILYEHDEDFDPFQADDIDRSQEELDEDFEDLFQNDEYDRNNDLEVALHKKNVIILVKIEVDEGDFDIDNEYEYDSTHWRKQHETIVNQSGKKKSVQVSFINPYDEIDITFLKLIPQIYIDIPKQFSSYLGFRGIEMYQKTKEQIDKTVNEINKKWDCLDSVATQNWYYGNNAEYKEQINKAKVNERGYFYEIIISDLDIPSIKKELSNYKSAVSFIPIPYFKPIIEWNTTSDHRYKGDLEEFYGDNRGEYYYEPSEEEESNMRERMAEEAINYSQYSTQKDLFEQENGGDYDDHLYIERLKDDDE